MAVKGNDSLTRRMFFHQSIYILALLRMLDLVFIYPEGLFTGSTLSNKNYRTFVNTVKVESLLKQKKSPTCVQQIKLVFIFSLAYGRLQCVIKTNPGP